MATGSFAGSSTGRPLYRVYVDEAGDRGWGGRSSEVFVLAAVIVPDDRDRELRAVLDRINRDFGRDPKAVLHWAKNVKEHTQRKHVAAVLAQVPAALITVVVHKACLIGSGSALNDPAKQYNYAVRRLLERVSWYVSRCGGEAILTFAHVRRFSYADLKGYLAYLKHSGTTTIKWHTVRDLRIKQPNDVRLLQMADLVAGCLYAATRPDSFGDHEPAYLLRLAPRIWTGPTGRLGTYGVHFVGKCGCPLKFPWWSDLNRACA